MQCELRKNSGCFLLGPALVKSGLDPVTIIISDYGRQDGDVGIRSGPAPFLRALRDHAGCDANVEREDRTSGVVSKLDLFRYFAEVRTTRLRRRRKLLVLSPG